jgi:hypothetical protein
MKYSLGSIEIGVIVDFQLCLIIRLIHFFRIIIYIFCDDFIYHTLKKFEIRLIVLYIKINILNKMNTT